MTSIAAQYLSLRSSSVPLPTFDFGLRSYFFPSRAASYASSNSGSLSVMPTGRPIFFVLWPRTRTRQRAVPAGVNSSQSPG